MALGHGRGALSPLSFYVPLVPSGDVDVSETLVSLIPDEWQQEEDFESFLQSLLPDDPLEGILALFDEPWLEDYPEPDFLAQFLDESVVVLDDPAARVALFDDYQDEEREPDYLAQFVEEPLGPDDPEARVALYEDWAEGDEYQDGLILDAPEALPDAVDRLPGGLRVKARKPFPYVPPTEVADDAPKAKPARKAKAGPVEVLARALAVEDQTDEGETDEELAFAMIQGFMIMLATGGEVEMVGEEEELSDEELAFAAMKALMVMVANED